MRHLVIMAGGSGTRFWPESRRARPKQFLTLTGDRSLIQEAAGRCGAAIPPERTFVVTAAAYAEETRRQLPLVPPANLLLEPCPRNTAPCVALAALAALKGDPDATLVITPADHVIRTDEAFARTVEVAADWVEANPQTCALIGIAPAYPATGFGYIERGESLSGDAAAPLYRVAAFREKPDAATAQTFLDSGRFYWNAGIFVWKARRVLELIAEFQPAIAEGVERLAPHRGEPTWPVALAEFFPAFPSVSVDYGLLEPLARRAGGRPEIVVVPASFSWSDVGSWQALPEVLGRDERDNTVAGPFVGLETAGCVVRTTADHLVATFGVENLVIVHTPGATLVAPKGDEAAIRRLVAAIEASPWSDRL